MCYASNVVVSSPVILNPLIHIPIFVFISQSETTQVNQPKVNLERNFLINFYRIIGRIKWDIIYINFDAEAECDDALEVTNP